MTGSYRSGGTILAVLLSAHPQVLVPGDLYRFPDPAWEPGRLCSCGLPLKACPFWSSVIGKVATDGYLAEMRRGQVRFEHWRSMPRAVLAQMLGSESLKKHVALTEVLVEGFAQETGKRVIIDPSRNPVRGRVASLMTAEGIDVRYIHIVRDGRDYMWAETYRPDNADGATRTWRHTPFVLAVRWMATNLFALFLCYGGSRRYLRVRYEDLLARPAEVLTEIGRFLDLDMTRVIAKVQAQEPVPIVHVLGGSRFRFEGATRLRSQPANPNRLTAGARATFWVVAGWLAGFFGYRVRQAG